ncbi:MAG: hypothetical protein AAGE52_27275 [Myxococcota bacterium]
MRASVLSVALMIAAGCASVNPDSVEGELSVFDPSVYEGEVFYLDQRISDAPLRAEDLGPDVDRAIPVGIRVHEHFAVAWHAPFGEPRVGDPDSVVTAWRIYGIDEVHAIANDVVATDEDEVLTPPNVEIPNLAQDRSFQTDLPRDDVFQTPPQFRVYWLQEYRDAWIRFWTHHPDC